MSVQRIDDADIAQYISTRLGALNDMAPSRPPTGSGSVIALNAALALSAVSGPRGQWKMCVDLHDALCEIIKRCGEETDIEALIRSEVGKRRKNRALSQALESLVVYRYGPQSQATGDTLRGALHYLREDTVNFVEGLGRRFGNPFDDVT